MSLLDDASLVMIPSGYKAGTVYSVKPTDGSGDLSFTRSNDTATRVNSAGLIEKVRTNLALQSNTFSSASWSKVGATVTAGQSDPNGGTNASKIDLAAGGNNYIGQFSLGSGIKTNSIWLRADSAVEISFNNGQNTNAITLTTSWVRYTITQTGTASAGIALDNYLGVTTPQLAVSFYVFQAQNETGDIATDYIPTTTTAVSVGMLANVPRLDYSGGGCPKLLLEPQRTNLALYSEQFDTSGWGKFESTIVANSATSPDGYTNADKLVPTVVSNVHQASQSPTLADSTNYAFSCFAKADGYNFLRLAPTTKGGTTSNTFFNLSNGTIGTIGSGHTATIEDYGNGWYRCAIVYNSGTGVSATTIRIGVNQSDGQGAYSGNGTDGIFIYGAQVEDGSYATSYIPTLAAAVTRGADLCSKTGISSLIGQTEGTLFVEINLSRLLGTTPRDFFIVSNGTSLSTSDVVFVSFSGAGSNLLRARVFQTGGVLKFDQQYTVTSTGNYKIAFAYKSSDCQMYVNGSSVGTIVQNDSFTVTLNQIITSFNSSTAQFGDGIFQSILFPTRLTNTQLAELTTL